MSATHDEDRFARAPRPGLRWGAGAGWLVSIAVHGLLLVCANIAVARAARSPEVGPPEPVTVLDLRTRGSSQRTDVEQARLIEPSYSARSEVPALGPEELVVLDPRGADPLDLMADAASAAPSSSGVTAVEIVRAQGGANRISTTRVGGRSARNAPSSTMESTGSAATGTSSASGTPPPLDTPPVLVDGPAPKFPALARRFGEEGDVRCRLFIDASGAVTRVDVLASSGSQRLDAAARSRLSAWRFSPATHAGLACSCTLDHVVTFRLTRAVRGAQVALAPWLSR